MAATAALDLPQSAMPSRTSDGPPLCWKRTQTVWATVPAPWGQGDAGEWFEKQPRRLVFSSRTWDFEKDTSQVPTLDVYAVGDLHPSDPRAHLACVLMGCEINAASYNRDDCESIFLCDWPALPRLVAEYAPLLKFHERGQAIH
jgi:hypothetical protein